MNQLNIDRDLSFHATAGKEQSLDFDSDEFRSHAGTGFNEYGVRENYDDDGDLDSVDVVFEAMEAGPPERRNGVRITNEFLREVGQKDYNRPPHLLDHRSQESFANIGDVREAWFSDRASKLALMVRVPNTGGQTHNEAIARYTNDPPAIRNGSVGFGNDYKAVRNEDGEPELVDGQMREFSVVNFPGGYDEGGVAAAFAEAAEEAVAEFSEHGWTPEEKERIRSKWMELTNMSEEDMEMWDDHPCADAGVDNSENWRDNTFMLMGQDEWNPESYQVANQAIDFIMEKMEEQPDNPGDGGPGSCPSRWLVSLMNRGHNPMDRMPAGNPQFAVETETMEFDDEPEEEPSDGDGSENSAADNTEFSVTTETRTF